jgi:hypothetical protein
MRVPCLVALVSALAATVMVPSASGQSAKWTPARTADGKPDLQGTFTFATITPLQRPAALSGKDVLSPSEAAEFEASENDRLNRDLFDPEKGQPSAGSPGRSHSVLGGHARTNGDASGPDERRRLRRPRRSQPG